MLRPAISHRVGGVEMIPPGGADVVFRFLGMVHSADTNCWDLLDGNLRVCLAQGWLSRERAPEEGRDERAAVLGSSLSRDPVIAEMLSALLERWAHVYADLGGRPCLVSGTRIVALDMERVMVTREDFAGSYQADAQIPAHSFITRLFSGQWYIAATSRVARQGG